MIKAENVSKFYGARQALKELSFTIEAGEVVGFLGLNGAGKTTVLKILSGLLLPSSGRIEIAGFDSALAPREVRRRIGFLPDRPPLHEDMAVRDVIAYGGQLNGMTGKALDRRLDEVLELADLVHVQKALVESLSHGFKQRVGIAQAIVHAPDLIILDEPISGLDPEQIVGMRRLVRSLAEKHTVLLSSHILGEISQTCDRLLVIHDGTIVARGTEDELTGGARTARLELLLSGDVDVIQAQVAKAPQLAADKTQVAALKESMVRVETELAGGQSVESLVAHLVTSGVGVRRVAEVDSGLESVFLRLTRGADTREVG